MLRQRSRTPIWHALSWRILFALALIGVALAVHWFDRVGLRDTSDGHVSLIDVVYVTMITVTTIGYGDIVPVIDRARLFDESRPRHCVRFVLSIVDRSPAGTTIRTANPPSLVVRT